MKSRKTMKHISPRFPNDAFLFCEYELYIPVEASKDHTSFIGITQFRVLLIVIYA